MLEMPHPYAHDCKGTRMNQSGMPNIPLNQLANEL